MSVSIIIIGSASLVGLVIGYLAKMVGAPWRDSLEYAGLLMGTGITWAMFIWGQWYLHHTLTDNVPLLIHYALTALMGVIVLSSTIVVCASVGVGIMQWRGMSR